MNYVKKRKYHEIYKRYKDGLIRIKNGRAVQGKIFYITLYDYKKYYKSIDKNHIFNKDHDIIMQYINLIFNKKLPSSIQRQFIDINLRSVAEYNYNGSLSYGKFKIERMYFRDLSITLQGFVLLTSNFIDKLSEYLKGKNIRNNVRMWKFIILLRRKRYRMHHYK